MTDLDYTGLCSAPNASSVGPIYAPVWEKTCKVWAEATYAMLRKNRGFIGPYMSTSPTLSD
eukprot:COSAG06_NODE_22287_length_728_cov_1.400636_1_plen_61_part_00